MKTRYILGVGKTEWYILDTERRDNSVVASIPEKSLNLARYTRDVLNNLSNSKRFQKYLDGEITERLLETIRKGYENQYSISKLKSTFTLSLFESTRTE